MTTIDRSGLAYRDNDSAGASVGGGIHLCASRHLDHAMGWEATKMGMRQKTRQYVTTAVESLTLAVEIFNRPSPIGRDHAVVMFAAHAFEMLLKGAIFQKTGRVHYVGTRRSYDLGKCIMKAETDLHIITEGDRVLLTALRDDRDTATHDVIRMIEDILWVHLRSAVSIFRRILDEVFDQDLGEWMPGRVLPVSASPPTDIGLVLGHEMDQIANMLAPGKRQGADARARLRPLVALDRATRDVELGPSQSNIIKIEKELRAGTDWRGLLPGLVELELVGSGAGGETSQEISLRLDPKKGELAVRPAARGEEALPYRNINVFDRFNIKLDELGPKLGLSIYEGRAIIFTLGLKSDPDCFFRENTEVGNPRFQGLSKKALDKARQALADGLSAQNAVVDYKKRKR